MQVAEPPGERMGEALARLAVVLGAVCLIALNCF
jgi:hypothetical protein